MSNFIITAQHGDVDIPECSRVDKEIIKMILFVLAHLPCVVALVYHEC